MSRTLWAVSDLHVTFAQNQNTVDALMPQDPGDWLIVAGDVAEKIPDVYVPYPRWSNALTP